MNEHTNYIIILSLADAYYIDGYPENGAGVSHDVRCIPFSFSSYNNCIKSCIAEIEHFFGKSNLYFHQSHPVNQFCWACVGAGTYHIENFMEEWIKIIVMNTSTNKIAAEISERLSNRINRGNPNKLEQDITFLVSNHWAN
ncbi:MAG: hypothetical protein HYW78_03740 [Parcubacteria group bacterium]|nr:hypothetical protein [Parcubacteria group bacterium]